MGATLWVDFDVADFLAVFCALAISRHIQSLTGLSIKKVLTTLQPLREAVLSVRGELIAVPAALTPEASEILKALNLPHQR